MEREFKMTEVKDCIPKIEEELPYCSYEDCPSYGGKYCKFGEKRMKCEAPELCCEFIRRLMHAQAERTKIEVLPDIFFQSLSEVFKKWQESSSK